MSYLFKIAVDHQYVLGKLGLGPDAAPDDVRKAYRNWAFNAHPDRGGDPEEFKNFQHIYSQTFDKSGGRKQTLHSDFLDDFMKSWNERADQHKENVRQAEERIRRNREKAEERARQRAKESAQRQVDSLRSSNQIKRNVYGVGNLIGAGLAARQLRSVKTRPHRYSRLNTVKRVAQGALIGQGIGAIGGLAAGHKIDKDWAGKGHSNMGHKGKYSAIGGFLGLHGGAALGAIKGNAEDRKIYAARRRGMK